MMVEKASETERFFHLKKYGKRVPQACNGKDKYRYMPYSYTQHLTGTTILDRIKWEIEAPSPQFNDVLALQRKCTIFSIIEIGGGGGVVFSSILSKIVAKSACAGGYQYKQFTHTLTSRNQPTFHNEDRN